MGVAFPHHERKEGDEGGYHSPCREAEPHACGLVTMLGEVLRIHKRQRSERALWLRFLWLPDGSGWRGLWLLLWLWLGRLGGFRHGELHAAERTEVQSLGR